MSTWVRFDFRKDMALVGVPVLLCIALVFRNFTQRPVWIDEAFSVRYGRLDWSGLMEMAKHLDAVFIPYYELVHVSSGGYPTVDSARLLSSVCAVLTLPIVYMLGIRLFDRRIAITATVLVATNAFFLEQAREARMYAPLLLLDTASWFVLLAAIQRPSFMRWSAFAALAAASLYVHPMAIADVFAQACATAFIARERRAILPAGAAFAAIVVAVVPLAVVIHAAGAQQIAWLPRPTLRDMWRAIRDGSGGPIPATVGIAAIVLALLRAGRVRSMPTTFLATWLLVPPAFAVIFSYASHPVLLARYLVELIPVSALLIAWGVFAIGTRGGRALAIVLLASTQTIGLHDVYADPPADWGSVTATLREQASSGDPTIVFPRSMLVPYQIALEHDFAGVPPLRLVYPNLDISPWPDDEPLPVIPPGYRRLWMIAYRPNFGDAAAGLRAHYRSVETIKVNSVVLERFVPKP